MPADRKPPQVHVRSYTRHDGTEGWSWQHGFNGTGAGRYSGGHATRGEAIADAQRVWGRDVCVTQDREAV